MFINLSRKQKGVKKSEIMDKKEQQRKECRWNQCNDVNSYCCTCGKLQCNEKKEILLPCCSRLVCHDCINEFPQRALFCHFCQIPYKLSPLNLSQEQPCQTYAVSLSSPPPAYEAPPTYETSVIVNMPQKLCARDSSDGRTLMAESENVLHFLDHKYDTLVSLSFRYGIPLPVLRRVNNITSDHLLSARRVVIIPHEYCRDGISLSPQPVEGEEKDREKLMVRRFMVSCKISEYDVALLYLKQLDFNLESAIEAYREDEKWEQENPLKYKGMYRNKCTIKSPSMSSYVRF